MSEITLVADDRLIEAASARAAREQTTLNDVLEKWLREYAASEEQARLAEEAATALRGKLHLEPKLTREQMHER